jgi:hypothetical protein
MKEFNLAKPIFLFALFFSLFVFGFCQAATLYLMPQSQNIYKGDNFIVDLQLDTESEQINTVEVNLNFPSNLFDIISYEKESSILTIWPEEPKLDGNNLSFIGGIPKGFSGKGSLLKVNLFAKEIGDAAISFNENSKTLLNDGRGTLAKLTFLEGNYEVSEKPKGLPVITSSTHPDQNKWCKTNTLHLHWDLFPEAEYSYLLSFDPLATPDEVPDKPEGELIWIGDMEYPNLEDGIYYFTLKQKLPAKEWSPKVTFRAMIDTTPPEEFKLEIAEIEGKKYLVFLTIDKTSGVDHYEIERHYRGVALFGTVPTTKWETVKNPYLLRDQNLGKIFVKAVDKAGNEQISEITLPPKPFPYWIIIPILIGALVIWWIIKKIQMTKSKYQNKLKT